MVSRQDPAYESRLLARLQAMLPERIYDAHFHISRKYNARFQNVGTPFEQYFNFTEKYLGKGRLQGGLVMPPPTGVYYHDDNLYNLELAKREGLEAGLIVPPYMEPALAEDLLDTYPQIAALKPYLTYSPAANNKESDILEFAPDWMWELADQRELPVMLHLSHYQDMLSDPANYTQLRYISKTYPKAKIVLAHCAMGHHPEKLRIGLEQIRDLENIWFDCSGSTEVLSIYRCIKAFGVDRMLYGGDYNHGESLGRICAYGSNFLALHPGYLDPKALPGDYSYQPVNNMLEGMLTLFDAGELLDLTPDDYEKIFYTNAVALFRSK